jgi:hypothetical protein
MQQIDDVLISDEAWTARFNCDLATCKGLCCEVGDLGAPISEEEIETVKRLLPKVAPKLSKKAVNFLATGVAEVFQGSNHIREIGKNSPCPLAFRDNQGVVLCSIHDYALEESIPVHEIKPLWCHLFPIILRKTDAGWIINFQPNDFCRSIPDAPPVLIAYADILAYIFGDEWINKVRQRYTEAGVKF